MKASVKQKKELLNYFYSFITDHRQKLFEQNIKNRTRYVTVVLEDIFQPQNASAILRTCDCLGIQDVHIIENKNKYKINPDVALGSSKWLNLFKYNKESNNTADCIKQLKKKGYAIIATTPHRNEHILPKLPLNKKTALLFGTELDGLSDIALEHADGFVKIPMYGFTESYNISVSAAITLYSLTERLHASKKQWKLPEVEKREILLQWAKNTVKKADLIEKEFWKKCKNPCI